MGGEILSTDLTHIKANRHKKKLVSVEQTPKAYMEELDVDLDRKTLGKKPFDRDGEDHRGGGMAGRMQSTTDPESGQQSRKAFITANTGRWTAGATSTSTSNLPTSTTSLRFLKSPTKSRCGWESCRSPWDWTRDATAQESPICWKRRESRASSAAGGTPTGRKATANAASDAPLLRCLHLPGAQASLLEDRHPRWECQYSATAKLAKPVRDGQRALERVWREGGWRDMSGRMLRTRSLP